MSKEMVFLADSSYAIRKISERNFSDENFFDLITFKSGQGLKQQLLDQKPHVVLVELKLPEWNGYEVCRFINSEPSLADTNVFLLRAAFDAVEEDKLVGMKYVDIVTKPFDHAALIEKIEKLKKSEPIITEESVPEGFPEIDDFDIPPDNLSFSDIKDEMDKELPHPVPPPDPRPIAMPPSFETFGEEVQPSEEITQGAIPSSRDPLSSSSQEDEIDNPFDDDSLHEHIKEQENELGIGSITQEALAIEASISKAAMEEQNDFSPEIDNKEDTSEALNQSDDSDESDDEFKGFTFDDNEAISFPSEVPETFDDEIEAERPEENEETGDFEVKDKEVMDSFISPTIPSFLDIAAPHLAENEYSDEISEAQEPKIDEDFSSLMEDPEEDEPQQHQYDTPDPITEELQVTDNDDQENYDFGSQLKVPEQIEDARPQPLSSDVTESDVEQESNQFDDFPGVEDPSDEENYNINVAPEPDNTRTSESEFVPDFPPPKVVPEPTPPSSTENAYGPITFENMTTTDREVLLQRIEQNISQTLKDILWDIIPPIAERILREEIESIKKEIAQTID